MVDNFEDLNTGKLPALRRVVDGDSVPQVPPQHNRGDDVERGTASEGEES